MHMQEDERGVILMSAFRGLDRKYLSNLRDYVNSGKDIFFGKDAEEAWVGWDPKGQRIP